MSMNTGSQVVGVNKTDINNSVVVGVGGTTEGNRALRNSDSM